VTCGVRIGSGLIDRLDRIVGLKTAEEVIPPQRQSRSHTHVTSGVRSGSGLIDRLDRIFGLKTAEEVIPPQRQSGSIHT
jgi:hypothetical protein